MWNCLNYITNSFVSICRLLTQVVHEKKWKYIQPPHPSTSTRVNPRRHRSFHTLDGAKRNSLSQFQANHRRGQRKRAVNWFCRIIGDWLRFYPRSTFGLLIKDLRSFLWKSAIFQLYESMSRKRSSAAKWGIQQRAPVQFWTNHGSLRYFDRIIVTWRSGM